MERKLRPIGAKVFKNLEWKDQLELVKLKLTDPERYEREVLGIIEEDPLLKNLIEDLAFLVEQCACSLPKPDGFPITITPHWIACRAWLDTHQHGRLLQSLNIQHRFFINTLLMRVPLLIVSKIDRGICRYLDGMQAEHKGAYALELLKFKSFLDIEKQGTPIWKYNKFILTYNEFLKSDYKDITNLEQLIGVYPVVSTSEGYSKMFTEDQLVAYWGWKRECLGLHIAPLFPKDLSVDGFILKSWHLLL